MVECELKKDIIFFNLLDSFNRYMVECEYLMSVVTTVIDAVLIDTWWNVNVFKPQNYITRGIVLIDTWWNVNPFQILNNRNAKRVLIDTWWNVNKVVRFEISAGRFCFNRYMVECEYNGRYNCRHNIKVLIDTWWNVNQYFQDLPFYIFHVLIDTWWNVNNTIYVEILETC